MAHCGYVGLLKDQLGGLPPALAAFAASGRQRQHVVGGLTDRSQDAPVLGRKGLSEILGEVRGGQRHGAYLSGCRPRVESILHVLVSPLFGALRSPDLLGQHCCSAVGFLPAGSIEPRPVRRSQGRTAQPRPAFIKQPKGAQHVGSTTPRRIFRGDKLPRPPIGMDMGNSKPPKTAWDQTWRRRFQLGAWGQACG